MAEMCVRCGKPTSDGARVLTAISRGEGKIYLHRSCHQEESAHLRRACHGFECNERIAAAQGPGRPREFHDEACRRRTSSALADATIAVARNRVPGNVDKVRTLLSKVDFLRCCWAGRRAAVDRGRPFPAVDAPRPELAAAAGQFMRLLEAAIVTHRARQAEARREAGAVAAHEAVQGRARQRAEADAAWRADVLKGVPNE